ncbi:unnamed protein product, partial [Ixodes pacificus]
KKKTQKNKLGTVKRHQVAGQSYALKQLHSARIKAHNLEVAKPPSLLTRRVGKEAPYCGQHAHERRSVFPNRFHGSAFYNASSRSTRLSLSRATRNWRRKKPSIRMSSDRDRKRQFL